MGIGKSPTIQVGHLRKEKGGRRIAQELPSTCCTCKKGLARPLGTLREKFASQRRPMSDRNGPSPIPPLSQSLAESSLRREHGLYVNATVDIKLLSSNLGKPWRLSTNYAPCPRFSWREVLVAYLHGHQSPMPEFQICTGFFLGSLFYACANTKLLSS